MTGFDRAQAWRAAGYGLIATALTVAVVVTTDEPYASTATRLARLSAMAPLLAAVAVFGAVRHAEARQEAAALAALGEPPWAVAAGAMYIGWGMAALGVLLLAGPLANVEALFPVVQGSKLWEARGAALVSPELGIQVWPGGELSLFEPAPDAARLAPGRLEALSVVVPMALVAPPWSALPAGAPARVLVVVVTAGLAIAVLHLMAAGRLAAYAGPAPAAVLLVHAGICALGARRLGRSRTG